MDQRNDVFEASFLYESETAPKSPTSYSRFSTSGRDPSLSTTSELDSSVNLQQVQLPLYNINDLLQSREELLITKMLNSIEAVVDKKLGQIMPSYLDKQTKNIEKMCNKNEEVLLSLAKSQEQLTVRLGAIEKNNSEMNQSLSDMKTAHSNFQKIQAEDKEKISKLEALVSQQMAAITKLQQSLSTMEEELENVAEAQEYSEQYGRRLNLEFVGLPYQKNEDTNQKVIGVAKMINVKLNSEDISTSHRLVAGKRSPIIVRFCRRDKRNELFRKKAGLVKENGDLAKAFDTVNHRILLEKLYHYGIRGKAFRLISSYLSGRKQYVENGENISGMGLIKCGVPQGSTIGPLLFLCYINDLPAASSFFSTLFADDTSLLKSASCASELQTSVNFDLHKVDKWLKTNKLSLNYSKTKFMLFCSKKKRYYNL
ncbi:uncharacterized protein LOC120336536 isoform X1 [Styela clava]